MGKSEFRLPGMDPGSDCCVHSQRWSWLPDSQGAVVELWSVQSPLSDWSERARFSDHCLWYRVFQNSAWSLGEFFLAHRVESDFQWDFDDNDDNARSRLQSLMSRPYHSGGVGGFLKRPKCIARGCPYIANSDACFRGY